MRPKSQPAQPQRDVFQIDLKQLIKLSAQTTATSVTVTTYDKVIYNQTDETTPVWAGPTTTSNTSPTLPRTLILAPWSMNVVFIQ